MSGGKTTIRPAYTLTIPGEYLGAVGDWHKFLMGADEMLELHASIGEALGLNTYTRSNDSPKNKGPKHVRQSPDPTNE